MKMPVLWRVMTALLLFVTAACNDDSPKKEQNSDSDSGVEPLADAGDTARDDETESGEIQAPGCENMSLCIEVGGAFSCPADVAEGRSCKTLVACEQRVVCASDEEACKVECGRVDCAILDTDPEMVQCPDH